MNEVNFLYFYFYFAFFYLTAVPSKLDQINNWVAGNLQEKPVFLNHRQGEKGPMSQTVKRESILLLSFFSLRSAAILDLHCHCHGVAASTLEKICASVLKNQKRDHGCMENKRKESCYLVIDLMVG